MNPAFFFLFNWIFWTYTLYCGLLLTHLFYIDTSFCTRLHEFYSIFGCQLQQGRQINKNIIIGHNVNCHVTFVATGMKYKMYKSLQSHKNIDLSTCVPLSFDTNLLSSMSHLFPNTIFSTSDDACWTNQLRSKLTKIQSWTN